MKKSFPRVVLAGLLGLLLVTSTMLGADKGSLGRIQVLFDRGLEGKTDEQKKQYNQVSDYFEPYFVKHFTRAGFAVEKITSREQFDPASGGYLLTVKTENYNPGSKAARMWVGMGAGVTTMKIRFEVFGAGKDALLTKEQERGSSRDWQFLCTKLSDDTLDAVKPVLAAKQGTK